MPCHRGDLADLCGRCVRLVGESIFDLARPLEQSDGGVELGFGERAAKQSAAWRCGVVLGEIKSGCGFGFVENWGKGGGREQACVGDDAKRGVGASGAKSKREDACFCCGVLMKQEDPLHSGRIGCDRKQR